MTRNQRALVHVSAEGAFRSTISRGYLAAQLAPMCRGRFASTTS